MNSPAISVLMSVHNGEMYLREAMDSILGQTFTDFEFVIINDASSDGTANIIRSYADSRIRLVENKRQKGLAASLNAGVAHCRCRYIARMDADDISLPQRLQKQFTYLEDHPEIGVLGSWHQLLDTETVYRPPSQPEEVKISLLRAPSLSHPTVMLRKEVLQAFPYDEKLSSAQDYELWTRVARRFQMANLPEVLLYYRRHERQISSGKQAEQDSIADAIRIRQVNDLIKDTVSSKDESLHLALMKGKYRMSTEGLRQAEGWFQKIEEANRKEQYYDPETLKLFLRHLLRENIISSLTDKPLNLKNAAAFLAGLLPYYPYLKWKGMAGLLLRWIGGIKN
jgi:glycosyltransferase involved in cell wall biosynthesis